MSDDNLKLWRLVERTDPAHVKPITGKSYKGNSPKPHWLVLKATETFGPCGVGWGFDVINERIEDAGAAGKLSLATVRVWFKWNGERGEVEHVGGTPFSGTRSSGQVFMDEDAPKKSVTDALTKALSMIGFAGDIFLGRWDDSKYQAELEREFAPKPARSEMAQRCYDSIMKRLESETDGKAIRDWWGSVAEKKVRADMLDRDTQIELLELAKKRIAELEHATAK